MPETKGSICCGVDEVYSQPIMIPAALVRVLSGFVVEHYACRGFHLNPEGMGEMSGLLARSWAVENPDLMHVFDLEVDSIQAWGAAFGEVMGTFLVQSKGVR